MSDRRMGIAMVITLALLSSMVPVTVVAADEVNLLPNGGFERDTDGDGVPDGWLSQPHHFSNETLDEVQSHIANLPSHEQLLKGNEVLAADGWPIAKAAADGTWGA